MKKGLKAPGLNDAKSDDFVFANVQPIILETNVVVAFTDIVCAFAKIF